MRAVGYALVGAFVELCQLALVFAAASIGAVVFDGSHATLKGIAGLLVFFAVYSLFVLYPARDLVQGWLGMIAGRQPERYDERGENLGRAVVAAAGSVALLALPLARRGDSHETQAFTFAFLGLAIVVFGLGSVVPRLWFTFRSREGGGDSVPELLKEAGTRGAAFFYCAFLGIGLALATASVALSARTLPADESGLWSTRQFTGSLCRSPTELCPVAFRAEVRSPSAARIAISAVYFRDPPLCQIVPAAGWPDARVERELLASRLVDTDPPQPPYVTQVVTGTHIVLEISLPPDASTCSYFLDVSEVR